MSLTTQEIHQQLFSAVEKGDLNQLQSLLEPPLTVNTIVWIFYLLFNLLVMWCVSISFLLLT